LDHLEDRRSKQFGGSLQSSLLLPLSRSVSILLTDCSSQRLAVVMIRSQYVYEVRPCKDHRDVDLISDALASLWYGEPDAISNAVDYAKNPGT